MKTSDPVDESAALADSWRLLEALFREQKFAALATQTADAPYASLVAFAVTPDLRRVVFPTRAGSRKGANLEVNPRVALLVDNRTNSDRDYHDAAAVTVIGSAGFARGSEADTLRKLLLERHPRMAGFLADSDCLIAVVEVTAYLVVTNFEIVTKLDPAAR